MHERRTYPHLLPGDAPILTEYLKRYGDRYTQVIFDHRIGNGRDPGPSYENNIRQMAIDLSQRRIDALGITPTEHHIIEVTDAAGTTAVGQLIAYKQLLQDQLTPGRTIKLVLVARSVQSDIRPALLTIGAEIHCFPEIP